MSKLKTLKDLDVCNGLYYLIKAEAINRVNNCCPNDNIGGTPLRKDKRCEACKRDIWFNNLTEEDLK